MENKKNLKHLIAILTLAIIFLALILFTSNTSGLNIKYEINDEYTLKTLNYYDASQVIGTIHVENNHFMPKRAFVNNIVLCHISQSYSNTAIQTQINIDKINNVNKDLFSSYDNRNFLDLKSKESVTLKIIPQVYKYDLRDIINRDKLNGKYIELDVFMLGPNDYAYNFCANAQKANSYKTIKVFLDIPEKELLDDEYQKAYATTEK